MLKFLANENIPFSNITYLKSDGYDIKSIGVDDPSISNRAIMEIAIKEGRTIITYDSDYGELIFKIGFRPPGGVVFIRKQPANPLDTANILMQLIEKGILFENALTVIDANGLRQRKY